MYHDIEARVPALDLFCGVFFSESPDDVAHSRRVFQQAGSELRLLAACVDHDGAICLKVPIPLGPGAVHGQEPEHVILQNEPDWYRDCATSAAADDGYGDNPMMAMQAGRRVVVQRGIGLVDSRNSEQAER